MQVTDVENDTQLNHNWAKNPNGSNIRKYQTLIESENSDSITEQRKKQIIVSVWKFICKNDNYRSGRP